MNQMNWNIIESENDVEKAFSASNEQVVVLFKHSTRCSVSLMAKRSLELDWDLEGEKVKPYFLDLIKFREISNEIARILEVKHESPQLIGIKAREVFYHASHDVISVKSLKSAL